MKIAKVLAVLAFLLNLIAMAFLGGAAAGTNPTTPTPTTIFVANSFDVSAYPTDSNGDVAPIVLTTDMAVSTSIARDASGRFYVANSATNTITVYAANANGNVRPLAVIGGPNTRLTSPTGIALDASQKIYVLNRTAYPKGNITVYPPLGIGTGILNEAPVAVIAGSNTLIDNPAALALDSHGDIYVANRSGGPAQPGTRYDPGVLTVYSAGSNGNVAPVTVIRGVKTGLVSPVSIALDSDNNIYVGNVGETIYTIKGKFTYNSSITVYSAGSTGNARPIAIITGKNTGLGYQLGIALDSNRNLYAAGGDDDTINFIQRGATATFPLPQASPAPIRGSIYLTRWCWIPVKISTF